MIFSLLVPAAGTGERLGAAKSKASIELRGEPLFVRAIRPFLRIEGCQEIVVAAPAVDHGKFVEKVSVLNDSRIRVITGGATRQESVALALQALTQNCDAILVHDAARPFVTDKLIRSVLGGLQNCSASLPGLPVKDTIKLADADGLVEETPPREKLFSVQTPQAVRTELFRQAHDQAAKDSWIATDDVSLIEHYHLGCIRIVPGSEQNFKITTPDDLHRALQLLEQAAGN